MEHPDSGVLLPLISACVYVFVYPYPARYIYEFTLKRQREINQTKQLIANETPLTREESIRLRAEYVEHERKNAEASHRLNEEIARLNAALDSLGASTIKPTPALVAAPDTGLDPTQLFMLNILEKLSGRAPESELLKRSPETKIKAEFDLGELEKRKFVKRSFDIDHGENLVSFTHEGRRILLSSKES
ncbi:MAG: hypothetical protein IV097_09275 [Burkholderiaceae bacterium]|nr:hypothetical protein [Burkholderiaceae bacterium]